MPARLALLTYDGSRHAEHAIRAAGEVLRDHRALVVHVWEVPSPAAILPPPASPALAIVDVDVTAEAERARSLAEGVVEQGRRIAQEAGFAATPVLLQGTGTSEIWSRIVQAAQDHRASVIVIGSRERSGLKSLLFGSVSDGIAHHAPCPVLVVPEPHHRAAA